LAGLNLRGLNLYNTTVADASANIASGRWRIFSSGTVASSGGIYAIDDVGQVVKLNESSNSGSLSVSGNATVSDVNTLQFSGATVSSPEAGTALIAIAAGANYGDQIADLSGSIDILDFRTDTLELSATLHEVRIDNVETSLTTISNSLATIMQGSITCNTSSYVYSVTHPSLPTTSVFPLVSLTVPLSSSVLYIQGITNRTTTGFDIVLSSRPTTTGYSINWTLPLSGSAVVVRAYDVSTTTMISGSYSPNAGAYDTFQLNYSGAITVNQPTSMANGQTINLVANSTDAGSTLTWNGYLFPGGASLAPTATANGVDIYTILRTGSNYFVTYAQAYA
jgi:hypothetical protein